MAAVFLFLFLKKDSFCDAGVFNSPEKWQIAIKG